jgi:hypothetical protein
VTDVSDYETDTRKVSAKSAASAKAPDGSRRSGAGTDPDEGTISSDGGDGDDEGDDDDFVLDVDENKGQFNHHCKKDV